jgi:hypothetical protein
MMPSKNNQKQPSQIMIINEDVHWGSVGRRVQRKPRIFYDAFCEEVRIDEVKPDRR